MSLLYGGLASVLAGAILFALDHYIHFYLIILFPIGAAFLVAMGLAAGIKSGKVRNGAIGALLGLLCALGVEFTYHYLSYQVGFKSALVQEMRQRGMQNGSKADVNNIVNTLLKEETGSAGFAGYMKLEAKEGIKISRYGTGGLPLNGLVYWLYVALETAIIGFICVGAAKGMADDPFNPKTDQWYTSEGVALSAPADRAEAVAQALKAGQWEAAGRQMSQGTLPLPRVELQVSRSSDPENVHLKLEKVEVVQNNKNKEEQKTTELVAGLVTEVELNAIKNAALPPVVPVEATPIIPKTL